MRIERWQLAVNKIFAPQQPSHLLQRVRIDTDLAILLRMIACENLAQISHRDRGQTGFGQGQPQALTNRLGERGHTDSTEFCGGQSEPKCSLSGDLCGHDGLQ